MASNPIGLSVGPVAVRAINPYVMKTSRNSLPNTWNVRVRNTTIAATKRAAYSFTGFGNSNKVFILSSILHRFKVKKSLDTNCNIVAIIFKQKLIVDVKRN